MHPTTILAGALTLFPVLPLANPLPATEGANLLLPRQEKGPTQAPKCTGCGIGLSKENYQELVDQIDTKRRYDIPFDSTQHNFKGQTTLSDGYDSISVTFEDTDTGSADSDIKGTIGGGLLKDELQKLIDKVEQSKRTCLSLDGQYFFSLGAGANCAG